MVNQDKTLKRLYKEKDYEERLASNLSDYILACLDDIKELTEEEKNKISKNTEIIMRDSVKHSNMIGRLIEMAVENNY